MKGLRKATLMARRPGYLILGARLIVAVRAPRASRSNDVHMDGAHVPPNRNRTGGGHAVLSG